MNTYFATNIKFLRKLHKMTQAELAYTLGIARTTISAWEIGYRSPVVADVIAVSDYFNIPIADLLDSDLSHDFDKSKALFNQNELLSIFNLLTTEQQDAVLAMIKSMVKD